MNYNTTRTQLVIPEYGRHIQQLINHAVKIESKEKRSEMAVAIVDVMGQLNPHLRDIPDFKHKLWDHMYIMSDYKLDVDSPYPIPEPKRLQERPNKPEYPSQNIRFKHYGKGVEKLVDKALEMEDGEEKDFLLLSIANLMKKNYLNWGRSSVEDKQILSDLKRISRGKISLQEDTELISSSQISTRSTKPAPKSNHKRKRKNFKPKKKY